MNNGKKWSKKTRVIVYTSFCVFLTISFSFLGYCITRSWWIAQYDRQTFNCNDMSYTLAPVFHRLGFDTKIISGCYRDVNNKICHTWLSLNGDYFDATSLWFDDEHEYLTITEIDTYPFGYWDEPIMHNDTVTTVYFGDNVIYINHTYPLYFENERTYNFVLLMDHGAVDHVVAVRNETGLAKILGDVY